MSSGITSSIHDSDVIEIKSSFWNQREIPEIGDIVEVQDGDKIRSYVYTKSGQNLEWIFQNELRIPRNDLVETIAGTTATIAGTTATIAGTTATIAGTTETIADTNETIADTTDLKDLETKKSYAISSGTLEKGTNTEDTTQGAIDKTTSLLESLQRKLDAFCEDKKIKSTRSMELLRQSIQDFINIHITHNEIPIDRCHSSMILQNKGSDTDHVPKKTRSKKERSERMNAYNMFMSKCLLRLKEHNKEILPSQRMAVAVEEWHKYKASKMDCQLPGMFIGQLNET